MDGRDRDVGDGGAAKEAAAPWARVVAGRAELVAGERPEKESVRASNGSSAREEAEEDGFCDVTIVNRNR
jgi:hypothetical protein